MARHLEQHLDLREELIDEIERLLGKASYEVDPYRQWLKS